MDLHDHPFALFRIPFSLVPGDSKGAFWRGLQHVSLIVVPFAAPGFVRDIVISEIAVE